MSQPRNLEQWLSRLESRHTAAIELGLERVAKVAAALRLDFSSSCVITVAGTNGKGSSVAMLDAALRGAGLTTASYTSPHLRHFSERVRIDGEPAADQSICEAFAVVEAVADDVPLTWFEFTTLAILQLIHSAAPDVCILEVGLGGRLDAVNVIDADIALVTSISIDHTDWLGDDREVIGAEKAGIFRTGAFAVCADENPPRSIAATAATIGARLVQRGVDFDIGEGRVWRGCDRDGASVAIALPDLELADGNLAGVVQVLHLLPLAFDRAAALQALENLSLAGRQQQMEFRGVNIVLDVAHNPASVASLAAFLANNPVNGRTFGLFCAMADKPVGEMLGMMSGLINRWCLCDLPDNQRAMPAAATAALLTPQTGADVEITASPEAAWQGVLTQLKAGDRLVVFGSFFLVGPVLTLLEAASKNSSLLEAKHA